MRLASSAQAVALSWHFERHDHVTLHFTGPGKLAAILQILETDLAQGPDAAREETVARLVDFSFGDASRDAIADFFNRAR